MEFSRQEVEKVALLARLRLSGDELDTLARQLGQIVTYVQQLSQLDTEDVEPMAHAVELHNVLADDEPSASLERQDALRNAPKHDGECYQAPAVLGQ